MNKDNPVKQHLPEPIVEKFLINQEKEIVLKNSELEVTKQKDKHSFEYAIKALEANKNDRDAQRKTYIESRKWNYAFGIIMVLIIFTFLLVAMHMGKDQIAMEVLKLIAYVGIGGLGGYSFGKTRKASDD